jgi:hypothetical protein
MRKFSGLVMGVVGATALHLMLPIAAAHAAPPPTCLGQPATIVSNGNIVGTNGDDVIVGGGNAQAIDGGAGNDVICGKGGDDNIRGGSGNDKIDGGGGDDKIYGEGGNDQIHGGDGNDRMDGGDGSDQIDGEGGKDDKADGGAGTDGCTAEKQVNCEGEAVFTTACNDGIDNDGDGTIDFGFNAQLQEAPPDPGCDSYGDNSELGTTQCDDGIDNDNDGRFDYSPYVQPAGGEAVRGDTDCDSPADDSEFPQCQPGAASTEAVFC